jgi:hypothetical protein
MNQMDAQFLKGQILKITIVWLSIFILAGFVIAKNSTDRVTLSVFPETPKSGEPIVITFSFSNPIDKPSATSYILYINGEIAESGSVILAPQSDFKHQYAYANPLLRGEQVNFTLKTNSETGEHAKIVSLPAYPPQLMSSFVSFAAFSTSVMSTMISMEYFTDAFGSDKGVNTGIIISIILSAILIFLELSQAAKVNNEVSILSRYRINLRNLSMILIVIFMGMVFTRTIMILGY